MRMRSAFILGAALSAALAGGLAVTRGLAAAGPAEASPPAYEIRFQEAWIPMRDGVRLAADLYLPQGGKPKDRFPVLLEYLPYRKTEGRGDRHGLYAYFVKRGYIVARVDI